MNIRSVSFNTYNSTNQTNQVCRPKTQKVPNFNGGIIAHFSEEARGKINLEKFIGVFGMAIVERLGLKPESVTTLNDGRVFARVNPVFDAAAEELANDLNQICAQKAREQGLGLDYVHFSFDGRSINKLPN